MFQGDLVLADLNYLRRFYCIDMLGSSISSKDAQDACTGPNIHHNQILDRLLDSLTVSLSSHFVTNHLFMNIQAGIALKVVSVPHAP